MQDSGGGGGDSRSSSARDRYRDRSRDRDRDRDRRDRYRDRSRERRHDDKHRVDRYRSDRQREDRYRDRDRDRSHRDRHDRERDHRSSSKRDRSRSRSRDRRRKSRSRSRDRKQEGSRSREGSTYSKDRERGRRDLSIEIEQELQNLRKLSDMKAAANAKAQESNGGETGSESKSLVADNSNESSSSALKTEEPKSSISKFFSANGNGSQTEYVPEIETEEERIEFQKKMQEKLQAHLAAEGKLYPKPKPTPVINTATGFANDGSFLEMFKKMQEQAQMSNVTSAGEETYPSAIAAASTTVTAVLPAAAVPSSSHVAAVQLTKPQPIPVPIVGRRRGGKILKTGVVRKQKPIDESYADTPNDAWNLYLQEVKKYKNASCDADSKTRPLVK